MATEMSVWEGVVVSPSEKAYEMMDDKDDDMENMEEVDQ